MEFLERIESADENLFWNIPEQTQGSVNVIGGNLQNFRTPVKIAEFLSTKYPLKTVSLVLPDTLKNKLPPLPNLVFLKSTDSGSLADADEILGIMNSADYNLVIGDLSKNSITEKAVAMACEKTEKPTLVTRDAVDLLSDAATEKTLTNSNLIIMASMVQFQKMLRAVYYPKMLLLTSPLNSVAETLHKFTLSYPLAIVTLHNGKILVAKDGRVAIVNLEKTKYSPINFWSGELAAKIIALNLFNPDNFLRATTSAIISAQF